uniref:Uncharacterized protein n=1 Tax=Romanomermis culicivorax TaxID=13658 RepID=A0A915JC00_ROMCU
MPRNSRTSSCACSNVQIYSKGKNQKAGQSNLHGAYHRKILFSRFKHILRQLLTTDRDFFII